MPNKSDSVSVQIFPGNPLIPGVTRLEDGKINFTVERDSCGECGVLIFRKNRDVLKLPFSEHHQYGRRKSIKVEGLQNTEFEYSFFDGEDILKDPYAGRISGLHTWGVKYRDDYRYQVPENDYNWDNDVRLYLKKEELILYLLHVRGFTMHESSGIRCRGTFAGVAQKAGYLKELGINAVELMPSCEFCETEEEGRINYWGFKSGYYMSPKSAYSHGENADLEFKEMVKTLHRERIGVIMQLYFPPETEHRLILDALHFWKIEYHVDGFHIPGSWICTDLFYRDPVLADSLLLFEENYHNGYLEAARHFLRGDEWSLFPFLDAQGKQGGEYGTVNYITNYCGFSLADLVSYEKKHNDANGEGNRDGENHNISWNCGIEGATEDLSIRNLRMQQMKNAFAYLLTSRGTPMIVSGDEFGFGRGGNNNPYCQDNEISWIDWGLADRNRELLDFVKGLISFRKSSGMFLSGGKKQPIRKVKNGYPVISWHGEKAWWLEPDGGCRHAGIMYCGNCNETGNESEDEYIYVIYNSDKEGYRIGLPRLPENCCWKCMLHTNEGEMVITEEKTVYTGPHSVMILKMVRKPITSQ